MKKLTFALFVVPCVSLALATPGFSGDYQKTGAAASGGSTKHKQSRVLVVDSKWGRVDLEDPCPDPRWRQKYLKIQKAVWCAVDGDTIEIRPGAYVEKPHINRPVKIRGAGRARTVITGTIEIQVEPNEAVRISDVSLSGPLDPEGEPGVGDGCRLENLRGRVFLQKILASAASGVACGFRGTVVNNDFMVVRNSQIAGNTVVAQGSAIDNLGQMRIYDSVIVNNVSQSHLGAVWNGGHLVMGRTLVSGNQGGGIYNEGTLRLFASVVEQNTPFDCAGCP